MNEEKISKTAAKERLAKLRQEIDHHRYLYHVLDKQEISDAALDSLKHELERLESLYPELITADSPSRRVGGEPLAKFEQVKHARRMLSLNDAFDEREMVDWEERLKKLAPGKKWGYLAELKLDGFALELTYQDGVLVSAATRGDGMIGENVTANVKTIETVPLRLREVKDFKMPATFILRGEVFMAKKVFEKINRARAAQGEALYANPRNTAAGSIRQLDPKLAARRELEFQAYEIVTEVGLKKHHEEHKLLKKLGFKIGERDRLGDSLKDVFVFYNGIGKVRERLKYQIDGLVVLVDDNELRRRFGVAGKAPRGAIAFKFPAEEATTVVEDIHVQVGRTGALTPVAELKPVVVAGTTVSRATLHNEDEIKRLGLKIGDTVIIKKAGDVIPDIVQVLTKLRTGKEKSFHMPRHCPICGSQAVRHEGESAWYCTNPQCFARQSERLLHFVSRSGFDIEGLGEKIVLQLLNAGLIKDAADLFRLTPGDLEPLERFAAKSAENLVQAIEKSKRVSLAKLIFALGIRYVGQATAHDLATRLLTMDPHLTTDKLVKVMTGQTVEELEEIEGVGQKVAISIYQWFRDPDNQALLSRLAEYGVTLENVTRGQKLKGLKFVLTGGLAGLSREEVKEKIRRAGGDVSGSVSRNTDYLVAGEEPGAKYKQAEKLGVKIIGEKELLKMLT